MWVGMMCKIGGLEPEERSLCGSSRTEPHWRKSGEDIKIEVGWARIESGVGMVMVGR